MSDLHEQKENLFRLIESWTPENIELGLQITKGNPSLLRYARKRYMPLIRMIGGRYLKDLEDFIRKISNIKLTKDNILPFDASLVSLFNNLPCQGIYCHYNKIEKLPWWLFEIQQLSFLDLSGQGIKLMPKEISKLKNLRVFRADRNSFEKLPDEIGELIELRKLQLDYNQLRKIPDSIGNLVNLEWLCLESNKIEKLPKTVANLESIEWLSIEKTPLGERLKIYSGRYVSQHSALLQKIIRDV